MKKIILLIILILSGSLVLYSQVPQAMTYKAIAKDDWGVTLPNKAITLRFTILQGIEQSPVYIEVHSTVTDKFGLMNVQIGKGTPTIGNFSDIDWSTGTYFIKIEMDPKGGSDFRLEDPAHQLLSVPYALYAGESGAKGNNKGDMLYWVGTKWIVVPVGSDGQILTLINSIPVWITVPGLVPVVTPTIDTYGWFESVTKTTAISGGNVSSEGGSAVTARGVCWSTHQTPTIADNKTTDGTGAGSFTSNLSGLSENTTYFVRAYATNSYGTAYGHEENFTTIGIATPITDVDGNVYQTLRIGTQVWMAENLKTTKYADGTPIPDIAEWSNTTDGAYCWYDNNIGYKTPYGALYSWYTIENGRNLCPTGWHTPTLYEWQTLMNFLGGYSVAGGKLKEAGTAHWNYPNTGATNESGFTALAGGNCAFNGNDVSFGSFGGTAYFWTMTRSGPTAFMVIVLQSDNTLFGQGGAGTPLWGSSVRCVKD
jgi:uncharacterized protein (TIGR02145 family)